MKSSLRTSLIVKLNWRCKNRSQMIRIELKMFLELLSMKKILREVSQSQSNWVIFNQIISSLRLQTSAQRTITTRRKCRVNLMIRSSKTSSIWSQWLCNKSSNKDSQLSQLMSSTDLEIDWDRELLESFVSHSTNSPVTLSQWSVFERRIWTSKLTVSGKWLRRCKICNISHHIEILWNSMIHSKQRVTCALWWSCVPVEIFSATFVWGNGFQKPSPNTFSNKLRSQLPTVTKTL